MNLSRRLKIESLLDIEQNQADWLKYRLAKGYYFAKSKALLEIELQNSLDKIKALKEELQND